MWLVLLPVLLLGTAPPPSSEDGAVMGKDLKNAAQHYRDALARARWSAGFGSLGALYGQARTLGPDRTPLIASQTRDYLEKATPAQKQRLFDDLVGLKFGKPDATPIPDLSFFLELNRTSREKESERFFNLLGGLYSPAFVLPYEDPTVGCTHLGKGQAVGVTRTIKSKESKVPHYKTFLDAEKDSVVKALLTTCACGSAADSQKEIQEYMKSYPKDPALKTLQDQLDRIAAHDPSLHYGCSRDEEEPRP